jgi:hypothetical protein
LAGVAWWIFAPLGWLGWLLVLAAAWHGLRTTRPSPAYEAPSAISHASSSRR